MTVPSPCPSFAREGFSKKPPDFQSQLMNQQCSKHFIVRLNQLLLFFRLLNSCSSALFLCYRISWCVHIFLSDQYFLTQNMAILCRTRKKKKKKLPQKQQNFAHIQKRCTMNFIGQLQNDNTLFSSTLIQSIANGMKFFVCLCVR